MVDAISRSNIHKYFIPPVRRALVLQGGRALGASQACAFKSLCEKNLENYKKRMKKPLLFDIMARTLISAIIAAIFVSYFVENKTSDGASEKLEAFWKYLSTSTSNISKDSKFSTSLLIIANKHIVLNNF